MWTNKVAVTNVVKPKFKIGDKVKLTEPLNSVPLHQTYYISDNHTSNRLDPLDILDIIGEYNDGVEFDNIFCKVLGELDGKIRIIPERLLKII